MMMKLIRGLKDLEMIGNLMVVGMIEVVEVKVEELLLVNIGNQVKEVAEVEGEGDSSVDEKDQG